MTHQTNATPSLPERPPGPITRWLEQAPTSLLTLYAALAAFSTYFCMYAFRKPFSAVPYEGLRMWGMDLKQALALSQIIGYTISKYAGIKVCSETPRHRRFYILVGLILSAESMLLLFAVLPQEWKVLAIFLNGLSLGMVWGICVLYVEGRRITEFLMAGLLCSFVISSGVVKDVGRYLMRTADLDQFWMPVVTGLVFLPLFLISAWLLEQVPPPTEDDRVTRIRRSPMSGAERTRFLKYFAYGVATQLIVYVVLTAFRDFRDFFGIEIYKGLGLDSEVGIFTKTEFLAAFGAVSAVVLIRCLDSRKWGVIPNLVLMLTGFALIGVSTLLFEQGVLSGFWWMVFIGIGGYLGYVPCDTIFYERVIVSSGWVGTAVFMAYVMDASGYTGALGLQLYKAFGSPDLSYVAFFKDFCYVVTLLGFIICVANMWYFPWRAKQCRLADCQENVQAVPAQERGAL